MKKFACLLTVLALFSLASDASAAKFKQKLKGGAVVGVGGAQVLGLNAGYHSGAAFTVGHYGHSAFFRAPFVYRQPFAFRSYYNPAPLIAPLVSDCAPQQQIIYRPQPIIYRQAQRLVYSQACGCGGGQAAYYQPQQSYYQPQQSYYQPEAVEDTDTVPDCGCDAGGQALLDTAPTYYSQQTAPAYYGQRRVLFLDNRYGRRLAFTNGHHHHHHHRPPATGGGGHNGRAAVVGSTYGGSAGLAIVGNGGPGKFKAKEKF
jgi:hypothetical protein